MIFLLARQIKIFNYNSSAWGDYDPSIGSMAIEDSLEVYLCDTLLA
jgi:hypothetical protein